MTAAPLEATPGAPPASTAAPQHPLWLSVLLHLLPGATLTAFVVAAAPLVTGWGFPPAFALFAGIGIVIVPLELGYLALQARRTTGSWSPLGAVSYREALPARRVALLGAGLFAWFFAWFVLSTLFLDDWIAATFFSWMPESILQFSAVEGSGDGATSATVLGVMLVVAFTFNGVLGPVTEELYFRGHLLPRISRFGRWAPVLNTVLFSLYHFWTPWQNPARIIGFLPIAWTTWRTRSVRPAVVAHVTINTLFLLGLLALLAGGSA